MMVDEILFKGVKNSEDWVNRVMKWGFMQEVGVEIPLIKKETMSHMKFNDLVKNIKHDVGGYTRDDGIQIPNNLVDIPNNIDDYFEKNIDFIARKHCQFKLKKLNEVFQKISEEIYKDIIILMDGLDLYIQVHRTNIINESINIIKNTWDKRKIFIDLFQQPIKHNTLNYDSNYSKHKNLFKTFNID
jgi:hypothetical protein